MILWILTLKRGVGPSTSVRSAGPFMRVVTVSVQEEKIALLSAFSILLGHECTDPVLTPRQFDVREFRWHIFVGPPQNGGPGFAEFWRNCESSPTRFTLNSISTSTQNVFRGGRSSSLKWSENFAAAPSPGMCRAHRG